MRRSVSAMRFSTLIPLIPLLCLVPNVVASPLALEGDVQEASLEPETKSDFENDILKRCANPCGWQCCESGQTCGTGNVCTGGSGGSGGDWNYWITTYIVTEVESSTITSVMSSRRAAATGAATSTAWGGGSGSGSGSGTCRADLGETQCGSTCCEAAQECDNGQCVAESSSAAVSDEPTPGVRGTSSGASTVTQTSSPTTTQGFVAPVGTDGSDLIGAKAKGSDSGGSSLSGGAIAGIVIGTIAGVVLLLLLCGCLCFRGALNSLLAALGMKKRNKKRTSVVEERYSHHSHGSRPRPQGGGRTWFGTRPHGGTESTVSEKPKSKWSGWGTVAIILGALALCLGLKRHRDREHDDDSKTSYTYPSSYYYSDYTRSEFDPQVQCTGLYNTNSALTGSDSSGRRTRDTRRTRRSRTRSRRS